MVPYCAASIILAGSQADLVPSPEQPTTVQADPALAAAGADERIDNQLANQLGLHFLATISTFSASLMKN